MMFLAILCGSARAHEGYAGLSDPVTGNGCCGGNDCAPVPLDVDWVTPVEGGYQVNLTVEQAKMFNPEATKAISEIVPEARVLTALGKTKSQPSPALYHICIWGNKLKCLFVVSST